MLKTEKRKPQEKPRAHHQWERKIVSQAGVPGERQDEVLALMH